MISHTHLDLGRVGVSSEGDGYGELFHEDRQSAQLTGEHKVEEGPQLTEIVLHRTARQDDTMWRWELWEGVEGRAMDMYMYIYIFMVNQISQMPLQECLSRQQKWVQTHMRQPILF